jgi:hypothetical protein
MCAAIRPLLTTGVALVGAAVIVANPIVVPPADIRIPAVHLSVGNRVDVLDPAFLQAIGAADPVSTNPIGVVHRLLENLVDSATDVGEATVAVAFAAGVVAAAEPSLILGPPTGDLPTALYRAVLAATAPLGPPLLIVNGMRTVVEHLGELTNVFPTTLPVVDLAVGEAAISPTMADPPAILEKLSTNLTEDAAEITGAVTAGFAAGAVSVAEPTPILHTLTAPASSDDPHQLYGAVLTATAPLGPPAVVVNSVRTVLKERLADRANVTPAAPESGASRDTSVSAPPTGGDQDPSTVAVTPQTPELHADGELPADDQGQLTAEGTAGATEGDDDAEISADSPNGATNLTDGNKFVPSTPFAPTDTKPYDPMRDAIQTIQDRVRESLNQIGDTLRRLTGRHTEVPTGSAPGGSGSAPGGGAPGGSGSAPGGGAPGGSGSAPGGSGG